MAHSVCIGKVVTDKTEGTGYAESEILLVIENSIQRGYLVDAVAKTS